MSTLVSPAELAHCCAQPTTPLLLDVRTSGEHAAVHISGSQLVPLDTLNPADFIAAHGADLDCVVVCQSGRRAQMAAEKLATAGMKKVRVLDGGVNAWRAAGLPVLRGKGVISIERQVRIAAGALTFLGAVLGTWVHPGFYGLGALVGAGLVFSGITDSCGMGLLLAKMPWNKPGAGVTCAVK